MNPWLCKLWECVTMDNNKSTTVYTFVAGDLFHANHVKFLELAKTYGDNLIVGVLSDEAIESYKRTPVYSLNDRLKIVSALKCIDRVVVQHSKSPLEVIKMLLPDVVVHADNWKNDFPDKESIESLGVRIEFTPYFEGMTTTKAIKKCRMMKPRMLGNEKNLKEALFKFKDFMDKHGIGFILAGGTLLGTCRNERLLPWDIDLDVYIPFKSYEDFVNTDLFSLLRDAYKEGFTFAAIDDIFLAHNEYFKYPELYLLPRDQQWKEYLKMSKTIMSTIVMYCQTSGPSSPFREHINGPTHIDCVPVIKGIHSSYVYDEPLEKVVLYGKTFDVLPDYMQYLSCHYGKNWQDVFCSFDLWLKHGRSVLNGNMPQEVEDFMKEWKPLLEEV